jgi:hypothetical protein
VKGEGRRANGERRTANGERQVRQVRVPDVQSSFLAVPGTVLRGRASRLRRLPVLAVGAHPWIGTGESEEGAVHPEIRRDKFVVRDITRLFARAGASWHPFRMRGKLASHPVVSLRSTTG